MIFTPRPYQKIMGDFAFNHERCNLFAGMGMGKTSESIAIYDGLRLFGEAKFALVIAPKRVARTTWPNEIVKWRESFGHLKIVAAIGTNEQRIKALRERAHITCINYENLEWLIETVGEHWPWDMVIADESTKLKGLRVVMQTSKTGKEFIKGQGSSRAKALAQVAFKKVRRWINLTGSPAPNGIVDLWGQMWFVDNGRRLGSSFQAFTDRWFRTVPGENGFGGRLEPHKHSQREIEDLIRDVCLTVEAKDWFDIKLPIERVVRVELPPKARAIYDRMEDELFAEIEAGQVVHEIEAFNAGSKSNKCLQIGSGAVYVDTKTKQWEPVHDEKLEALKSVVSEANGESILVSYQYIPERERILKAFPQARTLDNNPRTEADWNSGKIPMLVVHPASAGHGLNLQDGGRILCDFSTGWNLEYDEQVIERVGPTRQLQSGHDRAVFRYRLVAADTIEENSVLPRIKYKMSVQDSLKAAMKMRN
ncbi:DNA helicase [Curvibacter phage PCA1]|nr:DNA helicase [Curvibacter phage PCA1]